MMTLLAILIVLAVCLGKLSEDTTVSDAECRWVFDLGPLRFHRKLQWDLGVFPWLCVHFRRPNSSTRVFCVWRRGIELGSHSWRSTKKNCTRAQGWF